ncbi:hypothetical protein OAN24_02040 [Pseudodesulfovibrio sp.]|nr:hypothetical protein [Pseudodesulfovibrio sp.]
MSDKCEVMGVYSHSSEHETEQGERGSRYRHGSYWYVTRLNEETYEIRPINANHVPTNLRKDISHEEFLASFTPELSYYENNTLPCLETLLKKVRMGRRYFNLGLLDKSEKEFSAAVLMQDDSIRGNMGLSEIYAEQQEFTKLRTVLDKLLGIDAVFKEEQRHRFNEFGINLRKKGLFDDAVRFYEKALEVNCLDENLHFNIARAFHGKEQFGKCHMHLEKALELNPRMPEAQSFLRLIRTESVTAERLHQRALAKKGMERSRKVLPKSSGKVYVFDI